MKKIFLLIFPALLFGVALEAQTTRPSKKVTVDKDPVSNRDKAEQNTRPFSPAYFQQKENRHIVLQLGLQDNQSYEVKGAVVRVGNTPHRTATRQDLNVVIRDANGGQVGTFYTDDPTLLRSCEPEVEKTITAIPGTVIELALPYQPGATTIELFARDQKQVLEVGDAIRKAIADQK